MKVDAKLADSLAKRLCPHPRVFEDLRDHVDVRTGGELDCAQLDILTDMVEARLRKKCVAA